MEKKQHGDTLPWIIVGILAAAEEFIRRKLRKNGQEKIQRKVNESFQNQNHDDTPVPTQVVIPATILKDNEIDLSNCQEQPMSEEEKNEWKALISSIGSESLRGGLEAIGHSGLLKCDMPIEDLCKIAGNPDKMRGFAIQDGKITKQASFEEAGIKCSTPIIVYQCLAFATSQYYQQIISEKLNEIDQKLYNIIDILVEDDRSNVRTSFDRLKEFGSKNSFDLADKTIALNFLNIAEKIRSKYGELLRKINLNISPEKSDKKEAESKIKSLENSRYFEYLELAMQSELLVFIASVILVKIANYLKNYDDVKINANRINFHIWNNYENQFSAIKHDVTCYLELEAQRSWFQGDSIKTLKNEQENKFAEFETRMKKIQDPFNNRMIQYIKIQEDGSLKKYIRPVNETA